MFYGRKNNKKVGKAMFKKRSKKDLSKDSSPLKDLLPKQKNTLKPFSENLHEIKQRIEEIFGDTADLMIEDIQIGQRKGILCYLTTMTDWQAVTSKVLDPILNTAVKKDNITSESEWKNFGRETFSGSQHSFIEFELQTIENIINGYACIFIEGMKLILSIQIQATGKRAIEEPSTQTVVRGPKDGFIEDIETNISLIRKKIKNPALRFQSYTIGKETSTRVYLAYVDGIINLKILEEIRKRIGDVKTNALFDSGILEEFVEDKSFTPFPLVYNSERPDVVAAHLISGKFALFVDGSPFILTAPTIFSDFLSMSEDYYQPFLMGSFIRLIRYFSFLLALLLPSLYVAVSTFHYEMIPTQLLISIISQREGIPFPAVIEALMMESRFGMEKHQTIISVCFGAGCQTLTFTLQKFAKKSSTLANFG
ncbi:spore germination protein [Bacillaceae bacterium IKA-2]|nr:spore germination protein [Bacillaceae bacterium IKA-2]